MGVAEPAGRGATMFGDRIQFSGHAFPGDRIVDNGRKALPAEVVDDTQDADAAPVDQGIGHYPEFCVCLG